MVKKKKRVRQNRSSGLSLAIIALIINIFIPGLGSVIGGRIKTGIIQLILLIGGFSIGVIIGLIFIKYLIISSVAGLIMIVCPLIAWIWGIVTGVQLIQKS